MKTKTFWINWWYGSSKQKIQRIHGIGKKKKCIVGKPQKEQYLLKNLIEALGIYWKK